MRVLLFLADLLLKPIMIASRFDEMAVGISRANLMADLEGAKLLWIAFKTSVSQRVAPASAWHQTGGSQETLRNTIANLLATCLWTDVLAAIVLLPFEPTGWLALCRSYVLNALMWILIRPSSNCPASTTPVPYFLMVVELVTTGHSLVSTARFVLPVLPHVIHVVALILLAYAILVRHKHILVEFVLEIDKDNEPDVVPAAPDVESAQSDDAPLLAPSGSRSDGAPIGASNEAHKAAPATAPAP